MSKLKEWALETVVSIPCNDDVMIQCRQVLDAIQNARIEGGFWLLEKAQAFSDKHGGWTEDVCFVEHLESLCKDEDK